jgi:hypothetical protein
MIKAGTFHILKKRRFSSSPRNHALRGISNDVKQGCLYKLFSDNWFFTSEVVGTEGA